MSRHRTIIRLSAVLAVVALAKGCGDGDSPTAPPPVPDPPRPTTVTVSPATDELTALGQAIHLTAEVRDQNARVMAGATVIWTSSAISVATVDASGLVTAAGNGTATITASAGSASGSAVVTVTQSAASVVVSPSTDELTALGATVQLTAEAFDENGHAVAGAEFSWESSDAAVATVDESGLVTGVAEGVATITASAGEASGSAVVTVTQSAASVVVSPSTDELTALGATVQLTAEAFDENGHAVAGAEFSWESSDAAVATVDESGLVTGVAEGVATITASAGEASGSAVVTVTQSAASVVVSPSTDELTALGATVQLTAEAFDENGHAVAGAEFSWESSDAAVATVDESGLVTGVAEGVATITASAGEASGSAVVTVTQSAASVVVSPSTDELTALGATVQLTAEAFDENGHAVAGAEFSWESSDAAVATVDESGLVTGVAEGVATITASAGEASGSAVVTVTQSAASVVVSPSTDELTALGATVQLTAEAFDENGHAVAGAEFSWESSDISVATVDASGLVRGVGEGVATITARAGEAEGTAAITVGPNLELAALVALYEATDGPNWVNADNWLTDAPLGDWYGVDTDADGRVVRLDLGGEWDSDANQWIRHGLAGSIPAEIGGLSRLTSLSLNHNNLTGAIPPELGNLANLRLLILTANELSGPVPPDIGGLSNLTTLDLSENDLTGAIPPELGNLANLETLELGDNALSGAIPPELGRLANLWSLYLRSNNLTGPIPPKLGNLTSLDGLYLSRNNLTGPIPPELGNLANLRSLYLGYNGLTSLPPSVFERLSSLERIHLRSNKLEALPAGAFLGLSSLSYLDLSGNPGSPFRLTLELQRTDGEDLTAPGPANITVNVREGAPFAMRIPLSAEGGDLSASELVVAAGRVLGTDVIVTRNEAGAGGTQVAAGLAPPVPEDIRSIESGLAEPIVLFQPTAPTVAFVSRSESAPEGGTAVLEVALSTPANSAVAFGYTLGVDDDPESDDADASDHLHGSGDIEIAAGASGASIEIAIADDDDIEPTREVFTVTLDPPGEETGYVLGYPLAATVTIEEGVCDRTPRIRDEIVRRAATGDCARTDDGDLARIVRLDVRGAASEGSRTVWTQDLVARIRRGECEPGTWGMDAVGADTPTGAIACGATPEQTETAPTRRRFANDSGRDAITLREGDFAGLANLGVLDLVRLGLTELPPGVFAGLRSLYWLNLQYNQLTTLPAGVFSDLENLWEGLILADNRLTSFPETVFSGLSEVGLLILENNELAEVPARAFAGLSGVDWLLLNGNRLTDLPPGVFSDLSGLTVLNLAQNELSALPARAFENLSSLRSLYLGQNRLTSVPTQAFAGLSGLQRLGLDGNLLTGLPPGGFSALAGLTHLYLGGNPLGALQGSEFRDLPNLEDLYLSDIGLSELPPRLFSDLRSLERLDLGYNQLRSLPPGAFVGLTGLTGLRLNGNPGSPFPFVLEPRRTDTDNLLAPGPATMEVVLEQGAPINLTIPLTVHGGDVSASAVVLGAGTEKSAEVTVTQHSGNQSATQLVAGPAPGLPSTVDGIELLVVDPLVLFGTVSNLAPVAERQIPLLRMRVGGEAHSADVSSYFRDPDGDDLEFSAVPKNPDVVSASVSGGVVTLVPVAAGPATVTVTATDRGGLSAQLLLPATVRGASPGSYDIDLILLDDVTESVQAAFDDAVDYWSSILAGTELPDVPLEGDFPLGCWDLTTQSTLPTVDELVIVASVREIDGTFGILASAGWCGIRDGEGGLPFMGAMEFDVADLEQLEEGGDMEEVILHEMGHVVGIGTVWHEFGLLVNPSLSNPGADTHFTGPLAIAAFDLAGGADYANGEKVPVENRAGPGSGDAHWRESVLDHELMTPFQNSGVLDPLSAITIQSLADLGYTVDVSLAEPYRLPGAAAARAAPSRKIEYGDDILRGPIIVVDRSGRVVRVIPD